MKDFIFAVEDAQRWHEANIAANGGHYSGVAWLGSGLVARLQENVGASIYYNTHVELLDEVRVRTLSLSLSCSLSLSTSLQSMPLIPRWSVYVMRLVTTCNPDDQVRRDQQQASRL
jgi:hypothetical protein